MILIERIIADIFWEIKVISILLNIIVIVNLLIIIRDHKIYKSNINILKNLSLLIISLIYSFFLDISEPTSIIFGKILGSYIIFIIGMYSIKVMKYSQWIMGLSVGMIVSFFLMSLVGKGYQYWGDIRTFSGVYFFKTDLALAMVIAISYVLVFYNKNKKYKILIILITLYIIFKTNARMHFLTSIGIIFIYLFRNKILKANLIKLLMMGSLIFIFSLLAIITLQNLHLVEGLTIDFSDFSSDQNTQGRATIWEQILTSYDQFSLDKKLLGAGLREDVKINTYYGGSHADLNAHSGYIFALISFGIMGIAIFAVFMIQIIKRLMKNIKSIENKSQNNIILMTIIHTFVFFTSSFSNVTVLFQQETWFFFYFCGLQFNIKYFTYKK